MRALGIPTLVVFAVATLAGLTIENRHGLEDWVLWSLVGALLALLSLFLWRSIWWGIWLDGDRVIVASWWRTDSYRRVWLVGVEAVEYRGFFRGAGSTMLCLTLQRVSRRDTFVIEGTMMAKNVARLCLAELEAWGAPVSRPLFGHLS